MKTKIFILSLICFFILIPGCKKPLPTSPDLSIEDTATYGIHFEAGISVNTAAAGSVGLRVDGHSVTDFDYSQCPDIHYISEGMIEFDVDLSVGEHKLQFSLHSCTVAPNYPDPSVWTVWMKVSTTYDSRLIFNTKPGFDSAQEMDFMEWDRDSSGDSIKTLKFYFYKSAN